MQKSAYLDYILDWLSPLGAITSRAMMGGHILYSNGVVFALIAGNALFLKVDDSTRPRFEALNLKAFQPFPDKPGTMQYYPPPAEFFEDADVMAEWGEPPSKSASGLPPRRNPKPKPSAPANALQST